MMKKVELAEEILQNLLDNGMIDLAYGQEFWKEGREECIQEIKRKLDDYVIVSGQIIE